MKSNKNKTMRYKPENTPHATHLGNLKSQFDVIVYLALSITMVYFRSQKARL